VGAVYGSLLVNFGKSYFSETFPELWLFLMGGLFIAVVMLFPNGLAGLTSQWREWRSRGPTAGAQRAPDALASAAPDEDSSLQPVSAGGNR
jgi:urea transport system permease protein